MSFEEAIREVESFEFSARVNIASDFRTFLRAVSEQPAFHALFAELGRLDNGLRLITHVIEIARRPVNPDYENPWDTALTVFLWLISQRAPSFADLAAEAVSQAQQCWWATLLSQHMLKSKPIGSEISYGDYTSSYITEQPRANVVTVGAGSVLYFPSPVTPEGQLIEASSWSSSGAFQAA